MQVPLGTVVHRVPSAVDTTHEDEEKHFTFQQHWVGARDYVSSDEDDREQTQNPELEVSHAEEDARSAAPLTLQLQQNTVSALVVHCFTCCVNVECSESLHSRGNAVTQ